MIILICVCAAFLCAVLLRGRRRSQRAVAEYSRQLNITRGDTVILPDGQRGIVIVSATDTLIVETENGDMYSVERWVCHEHSRADI